MAHGLGSQNTHITHSTTKTDDAQVQANISPVIPRISGYVKEIRVNDNQVVQKGDTLLILDDRDLRLELTRLKPRWVQPE